MATVCTREPTTTRPLPPGHNLRATEQACGQGKNPQLREIAASTSLPRLFFSLVAMAAADAGSADKEHRLGPVAWFADVWLPVAWLLVPPAKQTEPSIGQRKTATPGWRLVGCWPTPGWRLVGCWVVGWLVAAAGLMDENCITVGMKAENR